MKNYYKILGVNNSAVEEDIKRAYRQAAKKFHPDINPGDSAAAQRFADINEAYETLSDSDRKAEYDKQIAVLMSQRNVRMARGEATQGAFGGQAYNGQNYGVNGSFQAGFAAFNPYGQFYGDAYTQAAQAQAQAQAVDLQRASFNKGYAQGFGDAQKKFGDEAATIKKQTLDYRARLEKALEYIQNLEAAATKTEAELSRKNAEISKLKADNKELIANNSEKNSAVTDMGKDASDLRKRADTLDQLVNDLSYVNAELEEQRVDLEGKLRAMTGRSEYNQDKRKVAEERVAELENEVGALRATTNELSARLAEWEEFSKEREFDDALVQMEHDWEIKSKEDKRKAKNTLYGKLGVLIWATDGEIHDNYVKLVKRYQKRKDDDKYKEKLVEVNEAYKILSDIKLRSDYNKSIDVTEEMIAQERTRQQQYEAMHRKKSEIEAESEFWERLEELMLTAQTGDADAQNALGEMYYYGDEIEKDLEQAVYWFKEAAKQQHVDALYNFGNCLMNGEGVAKDEDKGRGFIKQSGILKRQAVMKAAALKAEEKAAKLKGQKEQKSEE